MARAVMSLLLMLRSAMVKASSARPTNASAGIAVNGVPGTWGLAGTPNGELSWRPAASTAAAVICGGVFGWSSAAAKDDDDDGGDGVSSFGLRGRGRGLGGAAAAAAF